MNQKHLALAVATALTLGPSLAMAAPVAGEYDISDVTPYFVGLIAAITAIGGLKLAPAAVAVGFKWLKATVFG